MIKKGIIILLVLTAFRSCYYIDLNEHYVDISPGVEPQAVLSSNLDSLDPIVISDSVLFKYKIDIDTGQLYMADIYLGNTRLYKSDTVEDSIWIYPDLVLVQGDYDLLLVAYYQSLSGSLADLLNAEYFTKDKSWTLTITK